jgi:hypothetical protein
MENQVRTFTKKQYFTVLQEAVRNSPNFFETVQHVPVKYDKDGNISATMNTDLLEAFLKGELETLAKRATNENRKPTARQKENQQLCVAVLDSMVEGNKYTIDDIKKEVPECADLHTARVTGLLSALVKDEQVVRVYDKRKVFYMLAPRVEG